MVNQNDVKQQDIQEVTLHVGKEGLSGLCEGPFIIGNFPQANAIWSYRYVVATALLKRNLGPQHFTGEAIRDTEVGRLAARIKLVELPAADLYTARLEVTLSNGKKLTESTNSPKGDRIGNPLSKSEIRDKFWQNINFSQVITRSHAQKLLALLEDLENLKSVRQIVELLAVE